MPLKIISLPDQADVWDDYLLLLDSIREISLIANCPSILQVKVIMHPCYYDPHT